MLMMPPLCIRGTPQESTHRSGKLLDEPAHALNGLLDLVLRGAIGGTHKPFARRAERAARHDGHMLLEEELFGEFIGAEAGAGDGGEGVERSVRLVADQ